MGNPAKGHKGYIQWGREAAYGTAVAATKRAPGRIWAPKVKPLAVADPSLFGQLSLRGHYSAPMSVEVAFTIALGYDNCQLLIDAVMGTGTFGSNGGTTTGPAGSIYTHSFIERELLNSYTFEFIMGDIPTGKCLRVTSVVLSSMTIRGRASRDDGMYIVGEFKGVGVAVDHNFTPTVIADPTWRPIRFHDWTTFDDGTTDAASLIRPRSLEVTIDNTSDDSRQYGAAFHDVPLRNQASKPMWRIEHEFQSRTLFEAQVALTSCSPQIVFTEPGATGRTLTLQSGDTIVEDYSNPHQEWGIVIATAQHVARYNAGDASAVKLIVQNTQALITT